MAGLKVHSNLKKKKGQVNSFLINGENNVFH